MNAPTPTDAERHLVRKLLARRDTSAAWHGFVTLARDERWRGIVDIVEPEDDDFENIEIRGPRKMRTLFVCEKHVVQRTVETALGLGLERTATGTAHVTPWLTSYTSSVLRACQSNTGAQLVFLGDLDPDAVFQFGCLRAGGRRALLKARPPALQLSWGVDRTVVRAIRKRAADFEPRTIAMPWLQRKYWKLVKRLVPDARDLLGKRAFDLLERGVKLELDALCHDDDFSMTPALFERWAIA